MAGYKEGKEDLQQDQEQVHKIRITITSKNCGAIERISNELVKAAKDKQLKVKVTNRILIQGSKSVAKFEFANHNAASSIKLHILILWLVNSNCASQCFLTL